MSTGDWITLASICVLSAILAALWISPRRALAGPAGRLLRLESRRKTVYLFDGSDLIGHSDDGPADQGTPVTDWQSLHARLSGEFPAFPDTPDKIRKLGEFRVTPIDGSRKTEVHCEWIDGVTRVELRTGRSSVQKSSLEAAPVHHAMDTAPYPVWFLDNFDKVKRCNAAYSALARKIRGDSPRLDQPFFPDPQNLGAVDKRKRVSIETEIGDHTLWYDLTAVRERDGFMCYAVDANAVVEAEVARRDFVQTLSKTFAQLSTGLAIFDRNRQLALFNPALTDLTCLPVDFLSGRPGLSSFFDRLRNSHMMPEPKNYGSWRQQMNALFDAQSDGRYQETWSLPSGSVYEVSGRPHPDGAVAFLFQDISAEVTLTRRFRAELELGQNVLDRLDEAISVFATDGTLTYCNLPFKELWEMDPETTFAQTTVLDATRVWQNRCRATPVWGEIRDFVEAHEHRGEWWAQIRLRNGHRFTVSVSPLPNMATMVAFSPEFAAQRAETKTPANG